MGDGDDVDVLKGYVRDEVMGERWVVVGFEGEWNVWERVVNGWI